MDTCPLILSVHRSIILAKCLALYLFLPAEKEIFLMMAKQDPVLLSYPELKVLIYL